MNDLNTCFKSYRWTLPCIRRKNDDFCLRHDVAWC